MDPQFANNAAQFMTAPGNMMMYSSPPVNSELMSQQRMSVPHNTMSANVPMMEHQMMGAPSQQLPTMPGAALNVPPTFFNFTVEEIPFYSNLWRIANPQLLPLLENAQAAEFLKNSGLDTSVLHHIWELACSDKPTAIDQECFFVVLRLVAYAQAGQMLSPQHMLQAPPQLPVFVNVSRQRNPSEISEGSARSMQNLPDMNPTFMGEPLDPSLAGVSLTPTQASPFGISMNFPPSPGISPSAAELFASVGAASLSPAVLQHGLLTEAEKNKYLNVYSNTDVAGLGYLAPSDVRRIMEKSGLPSNVLRQIWDMSDKNNDGRLSEREFVVAMHLASRAKKGVPLPEELPASLLLYLATGELPIIADGSASAESATSMIQDTSSFPTVTPPSPTLPAKIESFPNGTFGDSSPFDRPDSSFSGMDSRREKKKKKDKKNEVGFAEFGDAFDTENAFGDSKEKSKKKRQQSGGGFDEPLDAFKDPLDFKPPSDFDDNFGDGFGRGPMSGYTKSDAQDVKWPIDELTMRDDYDIRNKEMSTSVLETIIESDKRLHRSLKGDVDAQADIMRNLQTIGDQLHRELVRERLEVEKQMERKREFEKQVYECRGDLDKMKEERRKVDIERISIARDLNHYQEEIVFLKRQIDETFSDIALVKESSKGADSNVKATDLQVAHLEKTRKDVLSAVKAEKEDLAREETEIAQMRTQLDRMKREKEDCQMNHQLLQEKFRQQAWMQGKPVSSPAGGNWNPENFKHTPAARPDDLKSSNTWGAAVSTGAPPSLRDQKGIPASSKTIPNDLESPIRRDESLSWASFGHLMQADPNGPKRSNYRQGVDNILNTSQDMTSSGHPLTDWPSRERTSGDRKGDQLSDSHEQGWQTAGGNLRHSKVDHLSKSVGEPRLGRDISWASFSPSDTPSFGKHAR
eukprot:Platyproteum_vivax@DN7244_c0_g1_i5.p1